MDSEGQSTTHETGPRTYAVGLALALAATCVAGLYVTYIGRHGDPLTRSLGRACAEAALESAKQMEARGNYEAALRLLRQALDSRFPSQDREFFCRRSIAEILVHQGRFKEAAEAYGVLPPSAFPESGMMAGYVRALWENRSLEEAKRWGAMWLEKAQHEDNRQQCIWANATLGHVHRELGESVKALAHYEAAAALDPAGDGAVHAAVLLAEQGRREEALARLDALLAAGPAGAAREHAARVRKQLAGD